MDTGSRDISLASVMNVRDLGGIKTTSGQAIKSGRLIRGANPDEVSEQDLDFMTNKLDVTLFMDLRATDEFESASDSAIVRRGIERVNIAQSDVVPKTGSVTDLVVGLVEQGISFDFRSQYMKYLGRSESVSTALNSTADHSGGVFMHCSAGKDRTGVLVAAALAAVGVHRDDIVDDYGKSDHVRDILIEEVRAKSERARTMWESFDHDALNSWISAPPERMEYTLDAIDSKYGSMRDYLLQLPDGTGLIEKLEKKLLG